MRRIGVVTVARSDYGIYRPLLRRIVSDPDLELLLYVTGMHLSPEFGLTVQEIENDGFRIAKRFEMSLSSDTAGGIGKSMGLGTMGFAQIFEECRPDILVVLGDRFEMHAAVVAALPFLIPVAHIAGGCLTLGAIDDSLRHSITKLSHLHFAETEVYASRLMQMGEDPSKVVVVGAMGLDNLHDLPLLSIEELTERCGLKLSEWPLLITFHPVTREYEQTESHMRELLTALDQFELPMVFTYPNADTNGRTIINMIEDFVSRRARANAVRNLGTIGYFSLMKYAAAMVGNSSSGIVEAASFKLPVVNIGNRQRGRIAAKNVISVGYEHNEIASGIAQAIDPGFRKQLDDLVNPYGDGHATEPILRALKTIRLDASLLSKQFYDQ